MQILQQAMLLLKTIIKESMNKIYKQFSNWLQSNS